MIRSSERRYPDCLHVNGSPPGEVNVMLLWPEDADTLRSQILFCVPGGGMNRLYFDLGGDEDDRYSFARQMATRGFVTVAVDTPGTGLSDKPDNGHSLTPDRVANALARTCARVMDDLRSGSIDAALPAVPDAVSIGIGHSMGAMLSVVQQAAHPQHAALALLGFGTAGLPDFLNEQARALASDMAAVREHLPKMARAVFPDDWPVVHSNGGDPTLFGSSNVDRDAVKYLRPALDVLLPVPAMLSLFPGNVAAECEEIRVPVLMALGENDLVPVPDDAVAMFPASESVALQVLPETGHSHFLFPARNQLFEGLAEWASRIENSKE